MDWENLTRLFFFHLGSEAIFPSGFPSVELEVLNAMMTRVEMKSDEFK